MEASYDERQRVNRALGELRAVPRWLIASVSLDASELARVERECAAGREAGQPVFNRRVASITKMPSADEFDTCEAASQQNQHCKSTDVDLARTHGSRKNAHRRETIDSVMAMLGLSCRREVEASLDSPRNELSLPCKQEVQNALSGFSHARRRRPR